MSETVDMRGGENAVVTAEGGARNMLSTVRKFFAEPSVQRSIPTAAAALVAFFGLMAYLFLQQPERTTLYASLPENEKARIVDALKNANVDVALDPSSGEVLVPTNDFHRSRILLAAQGLPASMPDGYKQLEDMPMGTSRSVENMRLKHSQEIELARSISEIDSIVSTRVHLAIPEKSVFVRNNPEPTASVMVQMANGRVLGRQQVDAIVHLVSSSVPGMPKQNVTIIDQNGSLLSQGNSDVAGRLSDSELEYRMRLENIYRMRIVSLVTPIVGAGNVNAQVNLDIDFTRSELTEEKVDPQGNALRSEQLSSDETTERRSRGIPGAVANTPPSDTELAQIEEQQEGGDGPSTRTKSTNEVRNYEVSRVISTTQNPSNQIARVFASVLVSDQEIVNPETGVTETQPLPQEKLDEIRELVRNAIGIDDERGDNLTVSSAPFVGAVVGERVEWYEQPWFEDVSQQIFTILTLAIVALGVIRPLLNRILVPVSAGEPGLMVVGEPEDESESVEVSEGESLEDIKAKLKPKKQSISADMLDTANSYDDKVAVIRLIVGEESGRVSNVFRAMMQSETTNE
jgi:flagellar M-ring protein FliF